MSDDLNILIENITESPDQKEVYLEGIKEGALKLIQDKIEEIKTVIVKIEEI